ncbi:unnamed protein product [Blepharisma stoltei]|uniref:Uncharacterized protein n=1 Tax=Blepharisma stoltei TaxID=1481888 RepID=A0AAU9JVH3_9CILI|nr:unnamed protein product [Blepharisma stoltei]
MDQSLKLNKSAMKAQPIRRAVKSFTIVPQISLYKLNDQSPEPTSGSSLFPSITKTMNKSSTTGRLSSIEAKPINLQSKLKANTHRRKLSQPLSPTSERLSHLYVSQLFSSSSKKQTVHLRSSTKYSEWEIQDALRNPKKKDIRKGRLKLVASLKSLKMFEPREVTWV